MNRYWVLLGAALVFSCGGPADEAADAEMDADTDAYYAEEEDEGVFDPMVGTIDRAKSVEDAGTNRKDEMDAAIGESEE